MVFCLYMSRIPILNAHTSIYYNNSLAKNMFGPGPGLFLIQHLNNLDLTRTQLKSYQKIDPVICHSKALPKFMLKMSFAMICSYSLSLEGCLISQRTMWEITLVTGQHTRKEMWIRNSIAKTLAMSPNLETSSTSFLSLLLLTIQLKVNIVFVCQNESGANKNNVSEKAFVKTKEYV